MKHHFVPQFLLRGWVDGSADGQLIEMRIDLPDLPVRRRAPSATGFVEGLYAATGPLPEGANRDAVETRVLQRVDNDAAKVRSKFLDGGVRSLTTAERSIWTRFLMAMRARQPKFVARMRELGTEEMLKTLNDKPEEYQALRQTDDPETLQAWVEAEFPGVIVNFGLQVFGSFIDNEMIGNKLIRMPWMRKDFRGAKHELLRKRASRPTLTGFQAGFA